MTASSTNVVIFKVGPVPCCVDSNSVLAVIEPPDHITAVPGSNAYRPGLFSYQKRAVAVYDVRTKFNLGTEQRGKIILTEIQQQLFGFWIDEIQQIVETSQGRSQILPPDCPKELFESLFLLNEQMIFKTNFDYLSRAQVTTRALQFIDKLVKQSETLTQNKKEPEHSKTITPEKPSTQTSVIKPAPNSFREKKQPDFKQETTRSQTNHTIKPEPGITPPSSQKEKVVKEKTPAVQSQIPVTKPVTNNFTAGLKTQSTAVKSPATSDQTNINKRFYGDQTLEKKHIDSTASNTTTTRKETNKHFIEENTGTANINTLDQKQTVISHGQKIDNNNPSDISRKDSSSSGFWLVLIVLMLLLPSFYFAWDIIQPESRDKQSSNLTQPAITEPSTNLASFNDSDNRALPDENDITESNENKGVIIAPVDLPPTTTTVIPEQPLTKNIIDKATTQTGNKLIDSTIYPEEKSHARIENTQDEITITLDDPDARFTESVPEDEIIETISDSISDVETDSNAAKKADVSESESTAQTVTSDTNSQIDIEIQETTKQSNDKEIATKLTNKKAISSKPYEKKVIHVVVKGDTLWHIAKRYIHNPFKYHELARLSKIRNPDLIYPGNKVIIIIRHNK